MKFHDKTIFPFPLLHLLFKVDTLKISFPIKSKFFVPPLKGNKRDIWLLLTH